MDPAAGEAGQFTISNAGGVFSGHVTVLPLASVPSECFVLALATSFPPCYYSCTLCCLF